MNIFTYVLTQYATHVCEALMEDGLKVEFAEETWSGTCKVGRGSVSGALLSSLRTRFDQVWADGSAAAQQQSSVSSLSTSAAGGGSSCPPVR